MASACSNTGQTTLPSAQTAGVVFDIKRFALHDGPGIRTTAFLKGCPLACSWCHNPESQSPKPELLVYRSRCSGCGACVHTCPEGAVRIVGGRAVTDRARCTACGSCVAGCPAEARSITGRTWTAGALAEQLARDRLFFEQSGGGITVSGGEPLLQARFCASVLELCHRLGLHTTVDTCGHADEADLRRVAEHTDLFLYDIKLMDDVRHRLETGVSNATALANLERLSGWRSRTWVRVPLIPGVNDDEHNLVELARFVRGLRTIEALQLLPYHRGGVEKTRGLERTDAQSPAVDAERAPDAAARAAQTLRQQIAVPVTIGG